MQFILATFDGPFRTSLTLIALSIKFRYSADHRNENMLIGTLILAYLNEYLSPEVPQILVTILIPLNLCVI